MQLFLFFIFLHLIPYKFNIPALHNFLLIQCVIIKFVIYLFIFHHLFKLSKNNILPSCTKRKVMVLWKLVKYTLRYVWHQYFLKFHTQNVQLPLSILILIEILIQCGLMYKKSIVSSKKIVSGASVVLCTKCRRRYTNTVRLIYNVSVKAGLACALTLVYGLQCRRMSKKQSE